MSTVGGQQRKRSQASRVGSSYTAKQTATQPMRANSIATMPSSTQSARTVGASSCNSGTAGQRKVSTEVWDPFQFECMTPGCRASSNDLLHALNEQRRSQLEMNTNTCCRRTPTCPTPCPMPCPPSRNSCDSGESDANVSDRRTAEFLYEMWCQQKLCDVMLRCCGEGNVEDTICAHKVR